MANITPIRADPDLLLRARRIFGDIVEKAYITGYHLSSPGRTQKHLAKVAFANNKAAPNDICYDAETIWLRFSNGRTVSFQNSEWAIIEIADVRNSQEV